MNNPSLKSEAKPKAKSKITPVLKPLVIKIGGAILEKESALNTLFSVISQLKNKQVVWFWFMVVVA